MLGKINEGKLSLTVCEVNQLAKIKAVLFDLHWTLAYVKKEEEVSGEELSDYLFSRGYEVSPQQLRAAWFFVAFIDYPEYGYRSWRSYFSRILWRLKVKVDKETLENIVRRLENRPYRLQWDVAEAIRKTKQHGFKTAIVTTIAHFQFKDAIKPIRKRFDFIMTGYEAGCDKTNPKMYRKVLEILNVKPEEAVMIGDDVQVDILLPKRVGMKAILLDRENKNSECQHADAVVNNLNDAVETVIRKISIS